MQSALCLITLLAGLTKSAQQCQGFRVLTTHVMLMKQERHAGQWGQSTPTKPRHTPPHVCSMFDSPHLPLRPQSCPRHTASRLWQTRTPKSHLTWCVGESEIARRRNAHTRQANGEGHGAGAHAPGTGRGTQAPHTKPLRAFCMLSCFLWKWKQKCRQLTQRWFKQCLTMNGLHMACSQARGCSSIQAWEHSGKKQQTPALPCTIPPSETYKARQMYMTVRDHMARYLKHGRMQAISCCQKCQTQSLQSIW